MVRPETFGEVLWNGVLAQFVVVSVDTGQPVGLVSTYGADHRNGTCFVAVLVEEDHRLSGWAAEGFLLTLDYVFGNWPMRKIYADVLARNMDQFRSAASTIFVQEGLLRQHELVDGAYEDVHLLACRKSDFDRFVDRLKTFRTSP